MSIGRRIVIILTGFLIVAAAVFLMIFPEIGYVVIMLVMGVSMLASGIGSLIYYFTMARHMVGGRNTLYAALIRIDLAILTLSLSDIPRLFIMLYLVAVFGVTGLLRVLRGLEAKKRHAPAWYWRFASGVVYLVIAFLCLIFVKNIVIMVIIYSVGLIFMGIGRIAKGFYRSKIVYIQ